VSAESEDKEYNDDNRVAEQIVVSVVEAVLDLFVIKDKEIELCLIIGFVLFLI
jgi:hypothetical protein